METISTLYKYDWYYVGTYLFILPGRAEFVLSYQRLIQKLTGQNSEFSLLGGNEIKMLILDACEYLSLVSPHLNWTPCMMCIIIIINTRLCSIVMNTNMLRIINITITIIINYQLHALLLQWRCSWGVWEEHTRLWRKKSSTRDNN